MMKLVVLSCLMVAASAGVVAPIAPIAYGASLAYGAPLTYGAPLAYGAPWLWNDNNYRGPLSLAPGQPANILGSDGRPLDTLDVNLDRSAHLTAKTLGLHLLKKRSASVIAPLTIPAIAHSSLIAPATRITYTAPLTTAHVAPITYTAPLVHW